METKSWKTVTVTSYVGLHIGVLLITATLPLALLVLGEKNAEDLPTHRDSFNILSHWLIGMGGITFVVSFLTLLASLTRGKSFRIAVAVMLLINTLLAVGLMVWSLVPTESRRTYLKDSWAEMKPETTAHIQNYYSCCGFEAAPGKLDDSCYIDKANSDTLWPDGCYNRMTSPILDDVSITNSTGHHSIEQTNKFNTFLAAFLFPLLFLILNQLMSFILCIVGLAIKTVNNGMNNGHGQTIENKHLTTTFSSVNENDRPSTASPSINNDKALATLTQDTQDDTECKTEKTKRRSITDVISQSMENAFYWIGLKVASYPKTTIVAILLLAASFSIGFMQRDSQVPGGSGFLPENDPIIEQFVARKLAFPNFRRPYYLLIVDKNNVLQEKAWKAMLDLDRSVKTIKTENGLGFEDLCLKVDGFCEQRSMFEFWNYNSTRIRNLTISEIQNKISAIPLKSPVFMDDVDITTFLGAIVRDDSGTIQTARAHLMEYIVGIKVESWEKKFLEIRNEDHGDLEIFAFGEGSGIYEATRSYNDDLYLLFIGFALIFLYILFMTGKFSLLEHRIYIALTGIISAGLGMVVGIGLTGALGFDWSAVHLVITFLVLGIGVDDMFILLQSWNNIEDNPEHKNKSITEKSGLVLKTAGVSITVTSLTDLVAFAVGASSDIVTFASFSVYVSVCIVSLFIIQCTFFLACIVLDQRRREARYDACLCFCYKHKESYKPRKFADLELVQTFFEDVLGRVLQLLPVKIIVILITLALTGFMGWGFYNLKVNFDSEWYYAADSYIHEYRKTYGEYFRPGIDSNVFVINADFYTERNKLHLLYEKLSNNTNLNQKYLTSWYENYALWISATKNISDVNADNAFVSPLQFYGTVTEYLQTEGRKYVNDVSFHPSIGIVASSFNIRHNVVEETLDNILIADSVRENCEDVGFSDYCFPLVRNYFDYAIVKVIKREVYRNLGITLVCVFIVVLPMIASIQIAVWVLVCVLFTLVNVAGSMFFAGFSIEGGTVVTLLLAVGLAVDYAAHVAHTFLILSGTRNMRMRVTLGQIGPAVFNGGFSTFIAVVSLSASQEYTYSVFFTVLSCVVGYGLWNGLVFLPSVLGLIGPSPHSIAVEAKLSERHYRRKVASGNEEENEPPSPR